MDKFIESVQSHDIPLDAFDKFISLIYVPFYYWFENTLPVKSWDAFMPPNILHSSFYQALQDFPILSGRFKVDSSSRGYVEVDRNNLNMPVYTDTDCDVEFKHLKDTGFKTSLLAENFDDYCGITAASRFGTVSAKLGIFHVRRLKNYSGVVVFASISHAIVDGYAYSAFINRWAEISKWMHENPTINESALPTVTFDHDRSIHSEYRLDGTDEIDDLLLKTVTNGNVITRFFSSQPIDKCNSLLKLLVPSANIPCCRFHVPTSAIESLRESVQEYAPPGTRYSTNDVLAALLTMVIGQATHQTHIRKQNNLNSRISCAIFGTDNDKPKDTLLSIPVNLRPRTNHPRANIFVGNLTFARNIAFPRALVQADADPENVSAIATMIRNAMSSMDKRYAGQLNHMMNSKADMCMRVAVGLNDYKNALTVTNIGKLGLYETDFGAGIPRLVRPTLRALPNVVVLMPCHPDIGGYELVITLANDVANIVVQNKSFMSLVDSHNLDI
ncbi:hypothetical protein LPJ59_000159 [Coemansia sp. RSA 2399]|nr:hypothetical protein LPJ59_000159 [Coemansia sp. RSA 2399]KAJ1908188.1 hypothetical protein LPJ81_000264 [Coemansia sp. IMI 209127]